MQQAPTGTWFMHDCETNPTDDVWLAPTLAINPAGAAIVVWGEQDQAGTAYINATRWSGPVLNTLGVNTSTVASDRGMDGAFPADALPAAVVDDSGVATVVWLHQSADGTVSLVSSQSAGPTWSAPVTLKTGVALDGAPHLAVASNGTVTAAWVEKTASSSDVWMATNTAAGWSSPRSFHGQAIGSSLRLAVGSSGAASVWTEEDGRVIAGFGRAP
jgi:hypothetical protein